MGGEAVDALRLDPRGVGGDRTHALLHEHKGRTQRLTAREAPGLLAWQAAYPGVPGDELAPDAPPVPTLTDPAGRTWRWEDPELAGALAEDLGRVVVPHRDPAGQQDLGDSVLVTVESTRRALEGELAEPIDLRRFRTNLHLEPDDVPGWSELGWEGGRLILAGGVELVLLHPCERCAIPTRHPDTQVKWGELLRHLSRHHALSFGINARVVVPGVVRRGEAISVRAPAG